MVSGNEKEIEWETVRGKFHEWRHGKRKSRKIPEHLWEMAADVARGRGVSRTAKELGLGYTELKKRVSGAQCGNQKVSKSKGTEPFGGGFVELQGLAWGGRICLEVKRPDGSSLRMEWQQGCPAEAQSLLRAFLGKN